MHRLATYRLPRYITMCSQLLLHKLQILTIFAKRVIVLFETSFAKGLYTTVDSFSTFESLSNEHRTGVPSGLS